MKEHYITGVIV